MRRLAARLDVLLDAGVVEKTGGGKGQGRTHPGIAELSFRIWSPLRTTRRMRLQNPGLARFLEVLLHDEALEAAPPGFSDSAGRAGCGPAPDRPKAPQKAGGNRSD